MQKSIKIVYSQISSIKKFGFDTLSPLAPGRIRDTHKIDLNFSCHRKPENFPPSTSPGLLKKSYYTNIYFVEMSNTYWSSNSDSLSDLSTVWFIVGSFCWRRNSTSLEKKCIFEAEQENKNYNFAQFYPLFLMRKTRKTRLFREEQSDCNMEFIFSDVKQKFMW